jgi:hypothetical protein
VEYKYVDGNYAINLKLSNKFNNKCGNTIPLRAAIFIGLNDYIDLIHTSVGFSAFVN